MMEMVLIRHGEPDTAACDSRNFAGQGYELAPLTQKGVAQAKEAAHSPLLQGAQMILSSPYTRALQTAAEISRVTGLEIRVESFGLTTSQFFQSPVGPTTSRIFAA
mgnify:CR=1 FL=1